MMQIVEVEYNWRGGLVKRQSTDYIVLHHAEAVCCSAKEVHSWHLANGWSGIGYHFFVRKDGGVYRGRPIWALGAHVLGMNNCSIGICAEGDYHNKDKTMPSAQKQAIKALVAYLKGIYPQAEIVGHKEIGDSNCPGRYYPLKELKNYNTEGLTMEQYEELKRLIGAQAAEITALKNSNEKLMDVVESTFIYNYNDKNVPDWAREALTAAIKCGAVEGNEKGELRLNYKDLCAITREYRRGMYD